MREAEYDRVHLREILHEEWTNTLWMMRKDADDMIKRALRKIDNRIDKISFPEPPMLPARLRGMTQARWDRLSFDEREHMMDRSQLHPALVGLEGKRVRVSPLRQGISTFYVGRTSGWRPCHLAMRLNALSSSDTIGPNEKFLVVEIADKRKGKHR